MSPYVTKFTVASRSASRSDCHYFVGSLRFLEVAARHCGNHPRRVRKSRTIFSYAPVLENSTASIFGSKHSQCICC